MPGQASQFENRRWILRLGAAFAAGLLALVLVELGLRAVAPLLPQRPAEPLWEFSTGLHHRLVPGARGVHETPEFRYAWHNNALGMRDRERTRSKPPGTLRILFLGDSMVQGHGLRLEDTAPARLEAILGEALPERRVEVLNAGVFGYSPMVEALYLPELLPLDPDLVLLGITLTNDVGEDRFYERMATRDAAGAVVFQDEEWPWSDIVRVLDGAPAAPAGPETRPSSASAREVGRLGALKRHLRVLQTYRLARAGYRRLVPDLAAHASRREREFALVRDRRGDLRFDLGFVNYEVLSSEERRDHWRRTLAHVREIRDLCHARSIPLALVVIPPVERLDGTTRFDEPYTRLDAFGREAGVTVIQLLPRFLDRGDPYALYYAYDRHWTPEGSALAARVVADALERQGLLTAPASEAG